jgi:hypothetical protein
MQIKTSLGLQMAIVDAGFVVPEDKWSMADRNYAMPTRGWLEKVFGAALWSFQAFFKVLNWTDEANDCDDFARLAAAFAQILHFLTPGRPPATALAIGELWYVTDEGGGHAINIAVCGEEVVTYEPQTRKEVTLSEQEKQRVSMVRF